jgi:hypothetical protein
MFTVEITDNKYTILNNGKFVSEYDKATTSYELIEKKLEILNRPKATIAKKVKGVVDNRHRNWRKRRR